MKDTKTSRSRAAADESRLCQYPYADGRQCRMLRHESHPSLCIFHAHEEQQLVDLDSIEQELASISGGFRTQTDINHVVGRLFKLVASGRIPARRAENLAYLAQLLLYSQDGIKYETDLVNRSHEAWVQTVRAAYPDATPALPRQPRPHQQAPQPQQPDASTSESIRQ